MEKQNNSRLSYNIKILNALTQLCVKHPDLRFGQLLVDCEVIELYNDYDEMVAKDPFNEESEVTLNRLLKSKIYENL